MTPRDVDSLSFFELKALVVQLLGEVSTLKQIVVALGPAETASQRRGDRFVSRGSRQGGARLTAARSVIRDRADSG
jgi:hypothetical protein